MLQTLESILLATWKILSEIAPFMLGGLLVAGLIHRFLPEGFIRKFAGAGKKSGVLLTALLGVPMPLCSCSVLPFAISLRKEGAGRGATLAFLTSTPQTGMDSILVAYAFFGWAFALYKAFVSFVSGLVGGLLTGFIAEEKEEASLQASRTPGKTNKGKPEESESARKQNGESRNGRKQNTGFRETLRARGRELFEILAYSYKQMLGDIAPMFLLGLVLAGIISALLPESLFAEIGGRWYLYPAVLLFSVPFYICSTASLPLAFSLVLKGFPPGAAMVFLIAGPATNAATIATVGKVLGKKSAMLYLANIAVSAIGFGLVFDAVLTVNMQGSVSAMAESSNFVYIISGIVLLLLLIWYTARSIFRRFATQKPASKENCETCSGENECHSEGH